MLAQYSGSDSGAAALGIIIALALIGLQIYLIYAIIATRQDVKTLRDFLMPRTPSQAYVGWGARGKDKRRAVDRPCPKRVHGGHSGTREGQRQSGPGMDKPASTSGFLRVGGGI
jgi:hypothetical protein